MRPAERPVHVFRLGRRPDPWAWPDWRHAGPDGTFGNRFDDPLGIYRVLYASTQRVATFVECLAYFRPDPALVASLAAIAADEGDEEPQPAGVVPRSWVEERCVGAGELTGEYVDLGHRETLAELRVALARRVVHHGLHDLDAASIRLSVPRRFTQEISRHVFDESVDGARRWNGIGYWSRHGDDLRNWALFEPASPVDQRAEALAPGDADLAAALRLHGLVLG